MRDYGRILFDECRFERVSVGSSARERIRLPQVRIRQQSSNRLAGATFRLPTIWTECHQDVLLRDRLHPRPAAVTNFLTNECLSYLIPTRYPIFFQR
jgi:hypothetical protein